MANINSVTVNGSNYDIKDSRLSDSAVEQLKSDIAKSETNPVARLTDLPSLPLDISKGGTGQTTAALARNALGLGNTTAALPIANGGTGNTTGNAATATKLLTARTIRTNLASTTTASFDGSANITPGVIGTLPIANGGTGVTTVAAAKTALGLPATLPTNVPAMPQTATGVGQWQAVFTSIGARTLNLPSGGTWAYFSTYNQDQSSDVGISPYCGVAAGGSSVQIAGYVTNIDLILIWRIS